MVFQLTEDYSCLEGRGRKCWTTCIQLCSNCRKPIWCGRSGASGHAVCCFKKQVMACYSIIQSPPVELFFFVFVDYHCSLSSRIFLSFRYENMKIVCHSAWFINFQHWIEWKLDKMTLKVSVSWANHQRCKIIKMLQFWWS